MKFQAKFLPNRDDEMAKINCTDSCETILS